MKTLKITTLTAALALGSDSQPEDSWKNLNRITHDHVYSIKLRDGHCETGSLNSADDRVVHLGDSGAFSRESVLRVSDYEFAAAHDTIFSGRSSWEDVKAAGPGGSEFLQIVTKRGEELKWQHPVVSNDSIAFNGRVLPKREIHYVSYHRLKPLTPTQQYLAHEDTTFLDPRLWFGGFFLGKISVVLYNANLPEDNTPITCQPGKQ